MLAPALIYDPRGHTFESWAALMCEQYAAQQLAVPTSFTNWREWGEGLKAIDVFTNEGIPGTAAFTNWQDWVEALVNAVSPQQPSI